MSNQPIVTAVQADPIDAPCSFHLRRQVDALLCVHFNGLSWSVANVPGVQPGDELLCGLPHPGGDLHVITCDATQPVVYAPRVATALDCEHLSAEDAQAVTAAMQVVNANRLGMHLKEIQRSAALLSAGLSEHGFKLQATSVIGESPAHHQAAVPGATASCASFGAQQCPQCGFALPVSMQPTPGAHQ